MTYECVTCKRSISALATVCPGCGEPNAGEKAKRYAELPSAQPPTPDALTRKLHPDEVLAAVIGAAPRTRAEVTQAIWAYIIKHRLLDAKQKTVIADGKLAAVFYGKKNVTMFEMTKLISNHMR